MAKCEGYECKKSANGVMRFLDRTSNIDALRQYRATVGMTGTNSKKPDCNVPNFLQK